MEEAQILKTAFEVAKAPVEIIKLPLSAGTMVFQTVMSSAFGLSSIVQFAQMIQQKLDLEKAIGGSDLETLLKVSGGDIHFFQCERERLLEVHQAMTECEIPHSMAPDLNPADNLGEIMFPTNAIPRVNLIMQKLGFGQTESPEEYIANADPAVLSQAAAQNTGIPDPDGPTTKLTSTMLEEQKAMQGQAVGGRAFADIPMEQKRMVERMQIQELLENPGKQAFSINIKSLVQSQDEVSFLTRIPGTKEYVRFSKANAFLQDEGKTLLIFEDKQAQTDIMNEQQEVIETINFAEPRCPAAA